MLQATSTGLQSLNKLLILSQACWYHGCVLLKDIQEKQCCQCKIREAEIIDTQEAAEERPCFLLETKWLHGEPVNNLQLYKNGACVTLECLGNCNVGKMSMRYLQYCIMQCLQTQNVFVLLHFYCHNAFIFTDILTVCRHLGVVNSHT